MFVWGFSEVRKGKKQEGGTLARNGTHLRGARTALLRAPAEKKALSEWSIFKIKLFSFILTISHSLKGTMASFL